MKSDSARCDASEPDPHREEVMRLLSLAWDGELTDAEITKLAACLQAHPDYARAADRMRRALGTLDALSDRDGQPDA